MAAWNEPSRWWWFGSRESSRQSPWLEATLDELDDKTKSMLKLIEGDEDSFAQRVEMYYEKRPELIGMVEDFYRAYRSLAERYDLIKSDPGTRLVATLGTPFASTNYQSDKFHAADPHSDSYSESLDSENYAMSEVADPEHENHVHGDGEIVGPELKTRESEEIVEVVKLREEIERLKVENKILVHELVKKDEERKVTKEYEISSEACNNEFMMMDEEEKRKTENSKLREEIETLKEEIVEVVKLREEIERLKVENKILVHELVKKDEERKVTKEYEISSEACNNEFMMMDEEEKRKTENSKLREEIETLKEENGIQRNELLRTTEIIGSMEKLSALKDVNRHQRDKLTQTEEEQRDQIVETDKSKKEADKCFAKMEPEIYRLKTENRTLRERLMQKDNEMGMVTRQLRVAVGQLKEPSDKSVKNKDEKNLDEYFTILQVEIKKLRTDNQMLSEELTHKDEAKREVIRQLSSAIGLLKDENVLLRNIIATKKQNNPFEFCKLTRKLFKGSPTSQPSVAVL